MNVSMPSWVGAPRRADDYLRVVVITTADEEGQDTLTVIFPQKRPKSLDHVRKLRHRRPLRKSAPLAGSRITIVRESWRGADGSR
jgi:hypothetical protein